ncbi:glycosyltransferase family 4 protein [Kocuria rhizosphaericola]|uniref:glycosyltransferase family 4 protein n=1 Tax=Kocuria rhizosphaericola TaxID=3376284 RepID=UPI0037BBB9F2
MKISIVHNFYRSSVPSGENFTVNMQAAALAEAGHDVQLVASHSDDFVGKPLYPPVAAFNVATGRGRSPLTEIQAFKADMVHVHNLFPNYSTRWLDVWEGPVVATLHNFRPLCANGLLFRDGHTCTLCPTSGQHNAIVHACYRDSRLASAPLAFRNRKGPSGDVILSRANKLIVLSERTRNTYASFGVNSRKLLTLPNFIDEIPGNGSIDYDAQYWIYAGRLTPEKGISRLLDMWPQYESLLIVGAGSDEESIRSHARRRDNITFAGALTRGDLLRLLPSAHGVVIPSLCAENLPTIYLEALAAGLPVVARSGNSAADDVEIWSPGTTYTSMESLAEALKRARSTRHETSVAARKQFVAKYSKKSWVDSVSELYESLQ